MVGDSSAWVLPLVAVLGSVIAVPVFAWVVAATIVVEAGDVDRAGARRTPLLTGGAVLATIVLLVVLGVSVLVLLLPIALWLVSRWLLAPAVCANEGVGAGAGLRRSRMLVRGHGWRAFGLVVTLALVAAVAGLIGALVLVLTPLSFPAAGLITALAGVVLVPYIALIVAHFYDDVVTPAQPDSDAPASR